MTQHDKKFNDLFSSDSEDENAKFDHDKAVDAKERPSQSQSQTRDSPAFTAPSHSASSNPSAGHSKSGLAAAKSRVTGAGGAQGSQTSVTSSQRSQRSQNHTAIAAKNAA